MEKQYSSIRDILRFYSPKQLLLSMIVDLYVFIISGGTLIIIFVNILPMVVRFIPYGLGLLYLLLLACIYLGNTYFIKTLQNYKNLPYINYKNIRITLTYIFATIIMIIMGLVFYLIP